MLRYTHIQHDIVGIGGRYLPSVILWHRLALPQAIPLFVTSTLVPLLLVLFRVIHAEDGSVMSANDATKYAVLFSPLDGQANHDPGGFSRLCSRLLSCFLSEDLPYHRL